MNTAAIYHRPESEFAYLYTEETIYSFAYGKRRHCLCPISARRSLSLGKEKWYQQSLTMKKLVSTELYDYWFIALVQNLNAFHMLLL